MSEGKTMSGIAAYRETGVVTQSRGQIVVMLYDGAIKFLEQAIPAIEKKDYPELIETLLNHSSTLGVRYHEVMRTRLARKSETIETRYGRVRAKRAFRPDGSETLHPEYDDLKKAAERLPLMLK